MYEEKKNDILVSCHVNETCAGNQVWNSVAKQFLSFVSQAAIVVDIFWSMKIGWTMYVWALSKRRENAQIVA